MVFSHLATKVPGTYHMYYQDKRDTEDKETNTCSKLGNNKSQLTITTAFNVSYVFNSPTVRIAGIHCEH